MKKAILLLITLISVCCADENDTPSTPIEDSFDPTAPGVNVVGQGALTGVGHSVSGSVTVYDSLGKSVLVLDPFSSQNGPDLRVYLSTDENASQYINVGILKSTAGKQSYDIPETPDLNKYRFVLVWCQEFSVLFGKAQLQ